MLKKLLAALCAVWITAHAGAAFAQPSTVGNDANPTAPGGIRILGSDGVNDYKPYYDASGYVHTVQEPGVSQIIQHWTAKTIGLGFADSSVAGFSTQGYSKIYLLIRYRQASTGTILQLAYKNSQSANFDTTNTWYSTLGAGARNGMTLPTFVRAGGGDFDANRMMRVLLSDSLAVSAGAGGQRWPMTVSMPWGGIYVKVVAGATCVIDLWLELVK